MKLVDFLSFVGGQLIFPQTLKRQPEPSSLTEGSSYVEEYNQALLTKMPIVYAFVLDLLTTLSKKVNMESCLDLACGPGHLTLILTKYLGFQRVRGVDLSDPMLKLARENVAKQNLASQIEFVKEDITTLNSVPAHSYDLVISTNAAHQFSDFSKVKNLFNEMERIANPEGIILVMDPARLKNKWVSEKFYNVYFSDYKERELTHFLEDAVNSWYAAWTPQELLQAIPSSSDRQWIQVLPRTQPAIQFILGVSNKLKGEFSLKKILPQSNRLINDLKPIWNEKLGPSWTKKTIQEFNWGHWDLFRAGRIRHLTIPKAKID